VRRAGKLAKRSCDTWCDAVYRPSASCFVKTNARPDLGNLLYDCVITCGAGTGHTLGKPGRVDQGLIHDVASKKGRDSFGRSISSPDSGSSGPWRFGYLAPSDGFLPGQLDGHSYGVARREHVGWIQGDLLFAGDSSAV